MNPTLDPPWPPCSLRTSLLALSEYKHEDVKCEDVLVVITILKGRLLYVCEGAKFIGTRGKYTMSLWKSLLDGSTLFSSEEYPHRIGGTSA